MNMSTSAQWGISTFSRKRSRQKDVFLDKERVGDLIRIKAQSKEDGCINNVLLIHEDLDLPPSNHGGTFLEFWGWGDSVVNQSTQSGERLCLKRNRVESDRGRHSVSTSALYTRAHTRTRVTEIQVYTQRKSKARRRVKMGQWPAKVMCDHCWTKSPLQTTSSCTQVLDNLLRKSSRKRSVC